MFAFLPLTYFAFWRLSGRNRRYALLTIASYIFYGYWDFRFCALMAFTTSVSYFAGLALRRPLEGKRRLLVAAAPITIDLCVLAVFKYAEFGMQTAKMVADWFTVPLAVPLISLVLPVGISFYTFHTITYIVDSYRRVITPTRNLLEFMCYVSLFSQLVAGPIIRFRQIGPDLRAIESASERRDVERALSFFVIGLAEKVLIADTIAVVINPALAAPTRLSTIDTWLCMLGYTYQIFFDFSGYSNMAVGLGLLFGIGIPQNFNSPYKAQDPSDFWRRWHISLSSFLRDYLYIPLGGGRGRALVVFRNVMITMLLGGLWHGASWTFVIWGGYHGTLLVLYRAAGHYWDRLPVQLRTAGTFVTVLLGWVLFRSDGFAMAATLYGRMFTWHGGLSIIGVPVLTPLLVIAALRAHIFPNPFQIDHAWRLRPALGKGVVLAISLGVILAGHYSPFLYFQF